MVEILLKEESPVDSRSWKFNDDKSNITFADCRIDGENVEKDFSVSFHNSRQTWNLSSVVRSNLLVDLPESNSPDEQLGRHRTQQFHETMGHEPKTKRNQNARQIELEYLQDMPQTRPKVVPVVEDKLVECNQYE